MTDTPQANTDIGDYRLAVERHLSDLPAPIREDLLSGLEEHLAEVSADLEPGVPLSHLLGSPEAYARELRETVEVPKGGLAGRFRRDVIAPVADRLRGASDRFAKGTGFEESSELRKALKPGWWVLRGLIAAGLIVYFVVVSDEGVFHTFRELGFLSLALVAALALFLVWLSLKLGTRSQRWGRPQRGVVSAGGVVLFGAGLIGVISVADVFMFGPSMTSMHTTSTDLDHVEDVYVYTEEGEPLTDVYLFDQNGNPLYIGDPDACRQAPVDPFEREEEYLTPGPDAEFPTNSGTIQHEWYGYQYPLCGALDEQVGDEQTTPDEEPTAESTTAEPTAEPTAEEPTTESPTEPATTETPSPSGTPTE